MQVFYELQVIIKCLLSQSCAAAQMVNYFPSKEGNLQMSTKRTDRLRYLSVWAASAERMQRAWLNNGSLKMVRNSGVCQDHFTRKSGTEKMLGLHKNLQQETRKLVACEPQTKRFAPFIGMFCFFFLSFFVFARNTSGKCARCSVKTRTWQCAQERADNVMSVCEEDDVEMNLLEIVPVYCLSCCLRLITALRSLFKYLYINAFVCN